MTTSPEKTIPDPLPFPRELDKWLSKLPLHERMKEYEIAEVNIKRILVHKGFTHGQLNTIQT